MKKYILIGSVTFSILIGINTSYTQQINPDTLKLSEELIIREIEKDVYIATHFFPWPCNSLICRLSEIDFILVDTPYENSATKLLVEWIKQHADTVNLRVINTHFHRDNLGGNGCLLEQGIPVYGSNLTVKLLNEKLNDPDKDNISDILKQPKYKRYYEVLKRTELKPPNHIFELNAGLTFDINNEIVEIYYPGPGHTQDNIVVFFHNRKILFGGCLIKALSWNTLGYTVDANVNEWPNSLKRLLNKYPQSRIVIPGHGEYGDLSLIHHTLKLLQSRE